MSSRPLLHLPFLQRSLLAEYERLHEEWRRASEAADEVDSCFGSDAVEMEQMLHHRLAADRVHREAMQLLRGEPI
jgi:hypothetical protein